MVAASIPNNEKERLSKLYEYSLLDTLEEEEYEQITAMAAKICGVPISLISLIDKDRQWFKSKVGLEVSETPREYAFCGHAINEPEKTMVVPDSRKDERFSDNPLVTSEPNVVFYAGVPLVSDSLALGTLCVIDKKPREMDTDQLEALEILANQVVKLFELRRSKMQLERNVRELEARNKSLDEFARVAAHDIKSPLANIHSLVDLLKAKCDFQDSETAELLEMVQDSAHSLSQLIDGILKHAKANALLSEDKSWFNLVELVQDTMKMLLGSQNFNLEVNSEVEDFYSSKVAFQQILINLMANAIKYNDKPKPTLSVNIEKLSDRLQIHISDNGPGIEPVDQDRIFKIFQTTKNKDRDGFSGNGIGLATVKSLVEGMGGEIGLKSEPGRGSTFTVSVPFIDI